MSTLLLAALVAPLLAIAPPESSPTDVPARGRADTGLSVYELDPTADGAAIALGGAATIVAYALSPRTIEPRCPCDPAEVNRFDRGAIGNHSLFADRASDVTVGLVLTAPLVLDWLALGWSEPLLEDAVVFLQALALNGALVSFAKHVYQRPLPRVYAGEAPELVDEAGGYRAFYSGHASIAFSALATTSVTINRRYGYGAWPWIGTVVIGGSVALERVAAGRHFPTDVLVGAAVGTAIGIVIPLAHRREAGPDGLSVRLVAGPDSVGIAGRF